jgi:hypothetical protein
MPIETGMPSIGPARLEGIEAGMSGASDTAPELPTEGQPGGAAAATSTNGV